MKKKVFKSRFANVKRMSKDYPDVCAYWEEEIAVMKVGDLAKIANGRERFWTVVKEINGNKIIGEVNNLLIFTESYNIGDLVEFKKENIYETWDLEEYKETHSQYLPK